MARRSISRSEDWNEHPPLSPRNVRYQIPASEWQTIFTGRNPRANSCRKIVLPFLFLHPRNFHVFYGRSIELIDCFRRGEPWIENYSLAKSSRSPTIELFPRFHSRFTSNFLVSRLNKSRGKGIVALTIRLTIFLDKCEAKRNNVTKESSRRINARGREIKTNPIGDKSKMVPASTRDRVLRLLASANIPCTSRDNRRAKNIGEVVEKTQTIS